MQQFSIYQKDAAMKVGTDGVLLGSWSQLNQKQGLVLDIGTGTGLVALMLAQRFANADIEAIEIESGAFENCVLNFENSPWNNRLFCFHCSLSEFVEDEDMFGLYDLIVCNPPFYSGKITDDFTARDLARKQEALPLNELFASVKKLLNPNGLFTLILPKEQESNALKIAQVNELFPQRILNVRGNNMTDISRILIEFAQHKVEVATSELIIETERNVWTQDYINLTKNFYLKNEV